MTAFYISLGAGFFGFLALVSVAERLRKRRK